MKRIWLAAALVLAWSAGNLRGSLAEVFGCGTTGATTSLRVENLAGVDVLVEALTNCTGTVEAAWSGAITLSDSISIGSDTFLSITGEDALAEVRGGSQIRLFEVSDSGGLALTGLRLSGGNATSGGAVFARAADITIDACVFENNVASDGNGGAVNAKGGSLTIVGGEFAGNSATGRGGAVWGAIETGLVVRDGTRFEGNTATGKGGGLYCDVSADASEAGPSAPSCSFSDVVFESNYSGENDGGAIYGAGGSYMAIDGCTFEDNTTPNNGGAVVADSATLGGNTVLTNNRAEDGRGGAVFGRNEFGTIEFNDVACANNAAERGGCFYNVGTGIVAGGATMEGNAADQGGCIYSDGGSDTTVNGGEFTGCRSTGNGAFLFASDGALVTIRGGTVKGCVAARRAGVVYCDGDSKGLRGSRVTIEGGTFADNRALEMGGAIAGWGNATTGEPSSMLVSVTGGVFRNNTAQYFGGFIFLEEQASLSCEGATIVANTAGDEGGGVYARDATWVNCSCDLVGNWAPQGAAAYLTNTIESANLQNHSVVHGSTGVRESVVYAAETSVFATRVDFQLETAGGGQDVEGQVSSGLAVQLEGNAELVAEGCAFDGWAGDAVIQSASPRNGSLVLDSCDFSKSSATMAVSSNSYAEIRNAFIGGLTVQNAAIADGELVLVDQAIGCDDPNACGADGACVDSALGVLCECLENGQCVNDGGALSIELKTPPLSVTYHPDPVAFELLISAAAEGTTSAIWVLDSLTDLAIQAVPSSGVLPPGEAVTVTVTGTPQQDMVGGKQSIRFVVSSVVAETSGVSDSITVEADLFLCSAFEFFDPDGKNECEQCASLNGAEGLDCSTPGATLAALPIQQGYWRSGRESKVVHACLHSGACAGGAGMVSSSDDYCAEGYSGPYCAVCTDGFGAGSDNTCHSCSDVKARWLIAAGCVVTTVALLSLVVAIAFLVGGLDAVEQLRRRPLPRAGRGNKGRRSVAGLVEPASPVRESSFPVRKLSASAWSSGGDGVGGGDVVVEDAPVVAAPALLRARGRGHSVTPTDHSPDGGSASRRGASLPPDPTAAAAAATLEDEGIVVARAPGCCGLGEKLKYWASSLPLNKVKILVVVWQILTVFPSISSVDFPPVYARFLSAIDFVNFDIGSIFSASCILPGVSFYHRLLLTTLAPLALALVLVWTYRVAKHRAEVGAASVIAKKVAWSRHMAAGLLLTFLVFTSTSTIVFKTFSCDADAVDGESYLRADYSLSCGSTAHKWFMAYAAIMIVVYPVGIPLLYAYILWRNRESLNPRVKVDDGANAGEKWQPGASSGSAFSFLKAKNEYLTKESAEELRDRLEKRKQNPDLVPTMFLWKDFGASMFYFEVIDCGRRILLTGVLVFIKPNTPEQAAIACMFAFASLLGFELLRPHLDPADSWIYRLGCVVIFLSNFLALLIKVDSAGGQQTFLGGILVAINILLFLAVLLATWVSTQQAVDDHREGESAAALAGTMLTFELKAAASSRSMRELDAAVAASARLMREHEAARDVAAATAPAPASAAPVSLSSSLPPS